MWGVFWEVIWPVSVDPIYLAHRSRRRHQLRQPVHNNNNNSNNNSNMKVKDQSRVRNNNDIDNRTMYDYW